MWHFFFLFYNKCLSMPRSCPQIYLHSYRVKHFSANYSVKFQACGLCKYVGNAGRRIVAHLRQGGARLVGALGSAHNSGLGSTEVTVEINHALKSLESEEITRCLASRHAQTPETRPDGDVSGLLETLIILSSKKNNLTAQKRYDKS